MAPKNNHSCSTSGFLHLRPKAKMRHEARPALATTMRPCTWRASPSGRTPAGCARRAAFRARRPRGIRRLRPLPSGSCRPDRAAKSRAGPVIGEPLHRNRGAALRAAGVDRAAAGAGEQNSHAGPAGSSFREFPGPSSTSCRGRRSCRSPRHVVVSSRAAPIRRGADECPSTILRRRAMLLRSWPACLSPRASTQRQRSSPIASGAMGSPAARRRSVCENSGRT